MVTPEEIAIAFSKEYCERCWNCYTKQSESIGKCKECRKIEVAIFEAESEKSSQSEQNEEKK